MLSRPRSSYSKPYPYFIDIVLGEPLRVRFTIAGQLAKELMLVEPILRRKLSLDLARKTEAVQAREILSYCVVRNS
jgi:hypothetical protein